MLIINGLKNPVTCRDCCFNYSNCLIDHSRRDTSLTSKPDWCPLKDAEEKLKAEYNQGYGDGLNDAWEAAKKISFPDVEGGIAEENMVRVFGFTYWVHVMETLTAAEAIAKIKVYEEKQRAEAEIHVGDEVIVNGLTGVVMKLDEKGNVDRYFTSDGRTFGNISGFQNNEVKKTGRHFPEVAELLEKMKEVDRNEN